MKRPAGRQAYGTPVHCLFSLHETSAAVVAAQLPFYTQIRAMVLNFVSFPERESFVSVE
jgi:hypothetical protein